MRRVLDKCEPEVIESTWSDAERLARRTHLADTFRRSAPWRDIRKHYEFPVIRMADIGDPDA